MSQRGGPARRDPPTPPRPALESFAGGGLRWGQRGFVKKWLFFYEKSELIKKKTNPKQKTKKTQEKPNQQTKPQAPKHSPFTTN